MSRPDLTPDTAAAPAAPPVSTLKPYDAEDVSPDGAAAASRRGSWQPALALALAAVCVLLAVAAVVLGLKLRSYDQDEQARRDALQAARQSALNLTSIDTEKFDEAVQRVLEGATGDFRKEFEDNSENLEKLLAENEVSAQGTVVEAGLVRADKSNATALVVVDSTVRNTATPDGRVNTYRMKIEVERVDDRWLTSTLRFVG